MSTAITTVLFLVIAIIFMTFAWYGHIKLGETGISKDWPLYIIILVSWGIALIEYCFQVPANRIGFEGNGGPFSLIQLKIMQEVITLVIFIIFSLIAFQGFTLRWNHIAACLLMVGAVYLVFLPQN